MGQQRIDDLFREDLEPATVDRTVAAPVMPGEAIFIETHQVVRTDPVVPDGGDQDLEITDFARIYDVPRFRIDDPRLNAGQQSACRPSLRGAVFGIQFGCPTDRSEEHTSELQSLMRISYAVFCLKKKKS